MFWRRVPLLFSKRIKLRGKLEVFEGSALFCELQAKTAAALSSGSETFSVFFTLYHLPDPQFP